MIEVRGLVKRYGGFEAVRGVSFSVGSGRVVGLLGPNGAGKTTIMKVLTGYHRPSAGSVLVDGRDVVEDELAVKASIGYLPEGVPLYLDMCVGGFLEFAAAARGVPEARRREAVAGAMDSCGLAGMGPVRLVHLSKGYRQRVGLAQAIVHDPPTLILDEPTTGLDPNQILEIRALIRSLGAEKTVVLSTHILQEVEALCSEVIILNEGRVAAQGSVEDIARTMKGDERIECVLWGEPGGEALAALAAEPSLSGAGLGEPAGDGRTRISVTAPASRADEAAEAVFDWAVANGLKLVEMRRAKPSLEELFVRITKEEASP